MPFEKGDSAVSHNFGIQIDGVMVEYVHRVTGLGQRQDVIEFKQNTAQGEPVTAKMPGVPQAGECTIVRAATGSSAFTEWIKKSFEGDMSSARKDATIIMMDYQQNPVRRFNLRNAWCSDQQFDDLEAGGTSPVTETITITYEEMKIEES
ncbi:phage tail-like protein [Actinomadura pelletieri DSM 43383]|uniref:Phage tail-like protein n=1 Tax=Actinomadura pelletieri DSM 43383 TaxID=1120940 RepID=A0A495QGE3_9ACTN|nr:type VI secretion system tube protein TssD [Actinomadura pelletieri]RKS70945.1 phage tail-like protein [Actinomadura pelletieri DSM 43383]